MLHDMTSMASSCTKLFKLTVIYCNYSEKQIMTKIGLRSENYVSTLYPKYNGVISELNVCFVSF